MAPDICDVGWLGIFSLSGKRLEGSFCEISEDSNMYPAEQLGLDAASLRKGMLDDSLPYVLNPPERLQIPHNVLTRVGAPVCPSLPTAFGHYHSTLAAMTLGLCALRA